MIFGKNSKADVPSATAAVGKIRIEDSPLLSIKNSSCSFDTEWSEGLPIVHHFLDQKSVSKDQWHHLFGIVSRITSWIENGGRRILSELDKYVQMNVNDSSRRINENSDDDVLLKTYISEWTNYSHLVDYLPLPFNCVERSLTKKSAIIYQPSKPLNLVRDLLLDHWNEYVFSSISDRLLNASMKLVDRERSGELIDCNLIIGIRESFVELGPSGDMDNYKQHFEKMYISRTGQYYKGRASQFLQVNGVISYILYANDKLSEEENRGRKYLDLSCDSLKKLMEKCVEVLVVSYQDQLLAECDALIKRNDLAKVQILYRLITRTQTGIPVMLNIVLDYMKAKGLDAMHANAGAISTDCEKFVDYLLEMYGQYSNLVRDAFHNDSRFLTIRDQAFQQIVNNTDVFKMGIDSRNKFGGRPVNIESRCPELLANYCDILLRKSALTKRLTSDEIDAKLNDLLLVLKYLLNKDIFMSYYKAHLSRRLILELVADQEKEEFLVTKFREFGMPADFVNKLFRMLQDIEINKDLNTAFKSTINASNSLCQLGDKVNIKILNSGAWSRTKDRLCPTLPKDLEDVMAEVDDFYRKQHCGRKLSWAHNWSTGTVTFANKAVKYDLELTTQQMVVLFCWNDRPSEQLSFESLRLATELSDSELIRALLSLTNYPRMKLQLLLTNSELPLGAKSFNDSTKFWVNQDFAIVKNDKPQYRGKINLIGRIQLSQESGIEEEHKDVLKLRELRVQEAIVKIMKTRKKLNQAQLQTELVEILKMLFLPAKKMMKEQIEWLIDNNYIKRSEDDINSFVYVS